MVYYVVRIKYPNGTQESLVMVLHSGDNLREQVEQLLGYDVIVMSIHVLGCDWPS